MKSSERPDAGPEPTNPPVRDGSVAVDGMLIDTLAGHYAEYHQGLAGPFDPVRTLRLTSDIFAAVKAVLTAIGQVPPHCPQHGKRTLT